MPAVLRGPTVRTWDIANGLNHSDSIEVSEPEGTAAYFLKLKQDSDIITLTRQQAQDLMDLLNMRLREGA